MNDRMIAGIVGESLGSAVDAPPHISSYSD